MIKSFTSNRKFIFNMSHKLTDYFSKATTKRNCEERLPVSNVKKLKTDPDTQSSEDVISKNEADPLSRLIDSRKRIKEMAQNYPALSVNIGLSWFNALEKEFSANYFASLSKFIESERKSFTIYPPEKNVYYWTNTFPIKNVKVVILGQDPYHGKGQAHGLAFSVPKGIPAPPSLINMFKELTSDIPGFQAPSHGCLYGWSTQGVLLLNTCLTVRSGNANSHQNKGWEKLTDSVIRWINSNLSHVVFMLWGGNAKEKLRFINKEKHLVLCSAHPSPLSAYRGFFGCRHFSKANAYLEQHDRKPINWSHLP